MHPLFLLIPAAVCAAISFYGMAELLAAIPPDVSVWSPEPQTSTSS